MSLTVTLLCPYCAAVIDMRTHRHGRCTRCHTDLTVNIWSHSHINRDAPFFPLVELIDNLTPGGQRALPEQRGAS